MTREDTPETERLYYADPYLRSFKARITGARSEGERAAVALDHRFLPRRRSAYLHASRPAGADVAPMMAWWHLLDMNWQTMWLRAP
jgi:hypothetical protein